MVLGMSVKVMREHRETHAEEAAENFLPPRTGYDWVHKEVLVTSR